MTPPPVSHPQGALGGIRVVDLTRYIPGPYCTMLLGDLGADVIKIEEPPIGDPTRAVPPAVGETSAVFGALNRNKRSIAVDIRSEAGAAVVRRLAEGAERSLPGDFDSLSDYALAYAWGCEESK